MWVNYGPANGSCCAGSPLLLDTARRIEKRLPRSCRQAHHAIIGPANCFEAASRAPKRFLKP